MKNFLKTLLAAFVGALAAITISFFVLFGMIGALVSIGGSSEPAALTHEAILKIDLSKPVTERGSNDPFQSLSLTSFRLGSEESTGILAAVNAIDKAAADPNIKFIYINASGVAMSITALEEIRDALVKFRDSGKPVIAYADNFSQGGYYIASVADKVYMNRDGQAIIAGIGMNMMFFKDLLDKLGIEFQLIRHGKFKAAAEQFVSNDISRENREQNQVMMDAIWECWANEICSSREMEVEEFNRLVNTLSLGDAESMVEYGMINEAVTERQMADNLCTLASVEDEEDLKFISLAKYAKIANTQNFKIKDKVAVIYAEGEISMDGQEGMVAKKLCPVIRKVAGDSSVKAVVLRVNSPGGDAMAAELIRLELEELREAKPMVVSFGDYAASGGYWISANSDRIFTDRTTLTGSIGVFSMAVNYGRLLDRHLDINSVSLKTHEHSDAFMGVRPLNSAEIEYFQDAVEDIYTKFTTLVAEGRDLSVEYVDSIGQGRVWAGSMAKEIRLADEIGGIRKAIEYAAMLSGATEYRVVEYPNVESSMEKFMKMIEGGESAVSMTPQGMIEECYSFLKSQNKIEHLARVPYLYEFAY